MQMQITLPKLHEGQRAIWDHPARFQVVVAGRRFGKSRFGALGCNVTALQGRRAWWVFPSYPMAAVGWRMLRRIAVQVPGVKIRESDKAIEYMGGGMAQIRSADNPDSLRGESLDYLVLDECAYMAEAAWTEALRPTLADRRGRAVFVSTPNGRNWFWRVWMFAQHDDSGEWQGWHFPTSANPYIAPAEIEAARKSLSERAFRQEFLAEFIEDGGGVFRRVRDAATAEPADRIQRDEKTNAPHEYAIGVDWGKHNDFTVLAVMDLTTQSLVHMDRFNQIDYTVQAGRLRALAERFNPLTIIAESNSMGEPLIEQLQRDGLPVRGFQTTNASKTNAIEALALAFERAEVRIIDDPVLIDELQAYEMTRLPGGMIRYSAPDGMHDDCVMALALTWQAAATGAIEYAPSLWS